MMFVAFIQRNQESLSTLADEKLGFEGLQDELASISSARGYGCLCDLHRWLERVIGIIGFLEQNEYDGVAEVEAIRSFWHLHFHAVFIVYQMDVKSDSYMATQKKCMFKSLQVLKILSLSITRSTECQGTLWPAHGQSRYERLSTLFLKHGYRRGASDNSVFKKDRSDILLVQVYVDEYQLWTPPRPSMVKDLRKTHMAKSKDEEGEDVDVIFIVTPKVFILHAVKRIFRSRNVAAEVVVPGSTGLAAGGKKLRTSLILGCKFCMGCKDTPTQVLLMSQLYCSVQGYWLLPMGTVTILNLPMIYSHSCCFKHLAEMRELLDAVVTPDFGKKSDETEEVKSLRRKKLLMYNDPTPFLEYYIELNDLNEPFELRRNQGDDLIPTIKEGKVIEEFRTKDEDLDIGIDDYPSYCYSDKKIHIDGALINVPIFVGTFSVVTDFAVLEYTDAYRDERMGDVIVGEPFLREVRIKARRFDGMITLYKSDDGVTYQMVRSHPRFKRHTNEQCNKIPPLLKVSEKDKKNGISHAYQKLKGFYKGVLNLGPDYIRNAKTEEWLTRGHISVHEME
ncbi:hypothetical protein Tco_0019570 [Tanacetum coccineum]